MLLKQETLRGIENGSITLAFRRWKRPTVKAGGTLLTSIGQLAVETVDAVEAEEITESEAVAAGFPDLRSLRSLLSQRAEGQLYRIRLSLAGPDPRIELRGDVPSRVEMEGVLQRLARLDSRSASDPWTLNTMRLISNRPGVRAADLAADCGMERDDFKRNVRKLKRLGLTESLAVGYRLSPRGQAVFGQLVVKTRGPIR